MSASKPGLENEIFSAYKKKMEAGGDSENSTGNIIVDLSSDIAMAINKYFTTAQVTTKVTVNEGQLDALQGVTDKKGEGEGTGTIVSIQDISGMNDTDVGRILKYAGEGEFEIQFEESGTVQVQSSDIELIDSDTASDRRDERR